MERKQVRGIEPVFGLIPRQRRGGRLSAWAYVGLAVATACWAGKSKATESHAPESHAPASFFPAEAAMSADQASAALRRLSLVEEFAAAKPDTETGFRRPDPTVAERLADFEQALRRDPELRRYASPMLDALSRASDGLDLDPRIRLLDLDRGQRRSSRRPAA
jgi:hypothetical protein